jgi:beta-phosphoglucomutase-like phosphatase (HAD superfamily)
MTADATIPAKYLPWIEEAHGLIFDCDGTLVDSMPLHFLAWHKTMMAYGLELPEDRFYALGGMPSHLIIDMLAREQSVDVDSRRAAQEKEKAFLQLIDRLEPIHAVLDVAKMHFEIKPMAVASGGFRPIIHQQLDLIGCKHLFQSIVTAEDTVRHKPEPDVFLEAARRLDVSPENCLVFEDADLGVQAAKNAGMRCIDVRDFYRPKRIPIERIF